MIKSKFKYTFIYAIFIISLFAVDLSSQTPGAPLFRDPIYDGAADPIVRWNNVEKNWWMLYTARHANQNTPGVAYCYGTNIGIASSDDNGKTWKYRGELDLDFEEGKNTFWAPEIIYAERIYHLFVTYSRGVTTYWSGGASIHHYTSKDMWKWEHHGSINLSGGSVIDATVFQKNHEDYYMWYKDGRGQIRLAKSKNLFDWDDSENITFEGNQEGPVIFEFGGFYWMLTDEWKGMRVYKSTDLISWEKQGLVLSDQGTRKDDYPTGAHGDVVVVDNKAFLFYFTHPGRKSHLDEIYDEHGVMPYSHKRSSIQVARLHLRNGTLESDRTDKFNDFFLTNQ